jgi:hypothetical protein
MRTNKPDRISGSEMNELMKHGVTADELIVANMSWKKFTVQHFHAECCFRPHKR